MCSIILTKKLLSEDFEVIFGEKDSHGGAFAASEHELLSLTEVTPLVAVVLPEIYYFLLFIFVGDLDFVNSLLGLF